MLEIDSSSEIKLSGADIYFDSARAVPLSFVTSANVENVPESAKIIATPETVRILGKKIRSSDVLSSPYGRRFTLGSHSIELIPSGHMLGAAQVVVEKDGKRLVYAGSFKLKNPPSARHAEIRRCDTLVVNCGYGAPKFVFPRPEAVMRSVLEFVNEAFFEDKTPVVLVNPVGKAQDLAIFLGERNVELVLHPSIAKVLGAYGELGVGIPGYGGVRRKRFRNKVLLAPFHYRDSAVVEGLERKKVAAVSGGAMENGTLVRSSFRAEVAFPLTNHAGYDEILDYLSISRPQELVLEGNFTGELLKTLRSDGWNVRPVKKPSQLTLF